MIYHYLKVAVRNLLKYKTQSLISIFGLAIGFACFALSAIWIRYEMTYDDFHEGAEHIYCIRMEDKNANNGYSIFNPYPLAGYLKDTFAEIKNACSVRTQSDVPYRINGENLQLDELWLDSTALPIFHLEILEGSDEFLRENGKYAMTDECARRIYGHEHIIGKEIHSAYHKDEVIGTVCAVVKAWPKHSNIRFDILKAENMKWSDVWYIAGSQTYIRLHEKVNVEDFQNTLYQHEIKKDRANLKHLTATPITAMRYDHPEKEAEVKFHYVVMFAVAGALVILCAVLNHITQFVSRIRIRSRELALRTVNGASSWKLFSLLMTEYLFLLFWAGMVGMTIVEVLMPAFKTLAKVNTGRGYIYGEAGVCCIAVIVLSTLLSAIPILYYKNKSLRFMIDAQKGGRRKELFRKASICFQLFVSIVFMFCSLVIMKQMYHLKHIDTGIRLENTASLNLYPNPDLKALGNRIAQIPEVTEVHTGHWPLFPFVASMSWMIDDWEGKAADDKSFILNIIPEDTTYANFYGLTLQEGEMIAFTNAATDVVLNETAVKALGWSQATGKQLTVNGQRLHVVGVMKDFHIEPPTIPVKPMCFVANYSNKYYSAADLRTSILFKFEEGSWPTCKLKIEQIIAQDYPDAVQINLLSSEEEYAKYLSSEAALLKMLGVLSSVCVLLSVFAIYSLVMLTCEQRRKEIAIRKVNGAKVKDILSMFMKEYLGLLVVAACLAFPCAYFITKKWLENYVRQTDISLWIYVVIFLSIGMVIIATIGWRVWKAANENPADVVKSE